MGGRKEDRHKMILPVVSSLLLASMAFGAPGANYGAAAHVSPAKQISSPSIQCRTEYVTLWDTEYQEREEQVCETVYEKQCETRTQRLCQPTTRQECTTNYVKECTPSTRMSASRSSGPSTSPTLSPSARPSTNKTASTSGGVMATTRCGLPSREPARTFPTTSAGTWPRPTQAGRVPGVQRRPRAEVRVRAQADLRHRARPDLQDRASDRVPGRAPPAVPLRAQKVPCEDQQTGAQEGLRRGAQHRSPCSRCRPPSSSLSAGSPQLRRPRRPYTECAPDH